MAALDYISSAALGVKVNQITGKPADGFTAGGYAAFVQAVTGAPPVVVTLPDKRAQVVLSQDQVYAMRKFLDDQVKQLFFKPKAVPGAAPGAPSAGTSLDLQLNTVFMPWLLKYLIPVCALLFVGGWAGHWYFSR
jgi:hypothetical protein